MTSNEIIVVHLRLNLTRVMTKVQMFLS